MMNNRRAGASKVAAKLFSSEDAIDMAITSAAELAAQMVNARREMRMSAVTGQEALEAVFESCDALVQARRAMVAGHKALSAVQREIGLDAVAFGGFVDKGPVAIGLTAVGSVAA